MLQNKTPVFILNTQAEREQGRKAQLSNITAGRSVGDLIRTTLGPKSMLKMLLDPMGGIVITSDGNAILREIDVTHPAAKSMIEIARAQDEEVGDGTTSVIVLTAEILAAAEQFLEREIHPTVIVSSYYNALEEATKLTKEISTSIDVSKDEDLIYKIVRSCIGTKFVSQWSTLITKLAVDAVKCVRVEQNNTVEIDVKRYAKIEKLPGARLEDCRVLDGVMFNKDVTHAQMERKIKNPRVILLDSPLEYKKGESMTNMEMTSESDFAAALRMEEEEVKRMCDRILAFNPDVVITEKGVSDLAQHYMMKSGKNVSMIRRIRKTDNNRIARVTGATIVNRPEELQESDVGTECGLFEIKKIGDEYFTFMVECKNPKACTILLRGGSKDVLNEVERNMHDAMAVARNMLIDPKLVPGGGALEMEISAHLLEKAKNIEGISQWPYKAIASAFEVIPRTLAQNAGSDVVRVMTQLRAKHAKRDTEDGKFFGIDGEKGTVADMRDIRVWDPVAVKLQTFKTAVETASMILRIDDIVSGMKKQKAGGGAQQMENPDVEDEAFGDSRDG